MGTQVSKAFLEHLNKASTSMGNKELKKYGFETGSLVRVRHTKFITCNELLAQNPPVFKQIILEKDSLCVIGKHITIYNKNSVHPSKIPNITFWYGILIDGKQFYEVDAFEFLDSLKSSIFVLAEL